MAIGASIQDPETTTVAGIGDGGIGMYISELRIAVENKLPLLVILFSDGAFGSIQMNAMKKGIDHDSLVIESPSWLKVVEAIGVQGNQAKSNADLVTVLESWDPGQGPYYIEYQFDRNKYRDMVKDIRS